MPRPSAPQLAPGERALYAGGVWTVLPAPAAAVRVPADDVVALFTPAEQIALHTLWAQNTPAGAAARMILEQFRMGAASGGIDPARPVFAAGLTALVTLGVLTGERAAAISAATLALAAGGGG